MSQSERRARALFRGFREREPTHIKKVSVPATPRAVVVMGYASSIDYDTTIKGVAKKYTHRFASGSRPLLCTDGKRLFLIKGRYRVTARGIVDIDSKGREEF